MDEHTEFVALSDAESAGLVGGGPIDMLVGAFVSSIIKPLVPILGAEVVKYWSDFMAGMSEGKAAALSNQ